MSLVQWWRRWKIKNRCMCAPYYIDKSVHIGKNVVIKGFKNKYPTNLHIGENTILHDNVEIRIDNYCYIGKGCTIHNNVHMVGGDYLSINDHTWIGERTFLDATGKLSIGANCTIGLACQIWTHVVRPRSTYVDTKHNPSPSVDKISGTTIGRGAWLMGGNIQVSPGVAIWPYSFILSNSVVTKDTEPETVYAGVPAKEVSLGSKWKILSP